VQLFFPDPWPKTRHHKRRIVQPDFMRDVARVLAPGGLFHAATDWSPYAEHMRAVIDASPELFENTAGAGGFAQRPASRPLTKFERRGERLGHAVCDLLYRRR
jgi:tRNA (guanine-N7-)-methyltransferase